MKRTWELGLLLVLTATATWLLRPADAPLPRCPLRDELVATVLHEPAGLSMGGVKLGDSQADVEARAAERGLQLVLPNVYAGVGGSEPGFVFHLDEAGKVITLEGTTLSRDGEVLLRMEDSEQRVMEALGPPKRKGDIWAYPALELEITVRDGKVVELNLGIPCHWECHC